MGKRRDWIWWKFHVIWRPMTDNREYTERGILSWKCGRSKTVDFFLPRGLFTITYVGHQFE